MGEILGIGTTHYPPGLVPEEHFNAPKCQAIFR